MGKLMKRSLLGFSLIYGVSKIFQSSFNSWGASPEEQKMNFPGEKKLKDPKIISTHGITINASPSTIWSWLIQLGAGRGGFYSYSWLENLVGCGVKNADHLVPELQNLKQGDEILLHPKAPTLKVTYLEKNKYLALEGWMF